ncbi:hypothetical protein QN277_011670 [Acacia crassicarpa]|uniref:Uncharacterized protein n=1 Tax=Acacia crassicarpa TaxID=499986 RepID=A0AAE1MZ62_9FABA|nr:hypothetical protein QN277_011670 [Acacia crassicarpa]
MKKQYSKLVRLLLRFLFVINALGHSSPTDILGQKENQKELEVSRMSSTFVEKETLKGIEAQYHVRKLGFGGKKSMVIHNKESNMDFSVKEKGSEDGRERRRTTATTTKISAENTDAVNKSMGRLLQGNDRKKEDQSYKSTTNSNYSQISEDQPHHQTHHEGTNTQKDEEKAKRSFQAKEKEEVMNFIHMDYKGMAHRKPPINNNEPGN